MCVRLFDFVFLLCVLRGNRGKDVCLIFWSSYDVYVISLFCALCRFSLGFCSVCLFSFDSFSLANHRLNAWESF